MFTEWVRGFLELGLTNVDIQSEASQNIFKYLWEQIEDRREHPKDDLISYLLGSEVDGEPVPAPHVLGTCFLLLVAGIDTTWSSIGSAFWHLAQHPEDRARLVAEPELMPRSSSNLAPTTAVSPLMATEIPKKSNATPLLAVSLACWLQVPGWVGSEPKVVPLRTNT